MLENLRMPTHDPGLYDFKDILEDALRMPKSLNALFTIFIDLSKITIRSSSSI